MQRVTYVLVTATEPAAVPVKVLQEKFADEKTYQQLGEPLQSSLGSAQVRKQYNLQFQLKA